MVETRNKGKEPGKRRSSRHDDASSKVNLNESLKRPRWIPSVENRVYEAAQVGDKYRCAIRGTLHEKKDMSIDHIVPWEQYCMTNADVDDSASVKAAYNDINNLRLVCRSANSSKGNRTRVKF